MEFEHSEKVRALQARVESFMTEQIYPSEEELFTQVNEGDRWQPIPLLEALKAKAKAKAAGLWNLFLPESQYGAGLTNLEYAPLCEIMGRSPPGRRRCSIARLRIPAIWKSWSAMDQRLAWIQHWLGAGLQAIETLLAEYPASGRFCHGESPTVADICLVTQVTPAMTFNLSLDPYPRVMRIYDTCMAIPAFADAHPSKQLDAE
jgi:acyl-CoA dehydrogenase